MLVHWDSNQRRLAKAVMLVAFVFIAGTVGFRILSPGVPDAHGNMVPATWLQCAYMTVISLTTVGYSESVPVGDRPELMVFTIVLLLVGIGAITYTFGAITTFFIEGALTDVFWRRKMRKSLAEISDHYIVCGAGETSLTAIRELHKTRRPMVVIDSDPEVVQQLSQEFEMCGVVGDASHEDTLTKARIEHAVGLLASLPTDKDNLFLVITANQLNDRMRIVAKVTDPDNNQKFRKAGASALASPQVIGGLRLVSELIRPSVVSFLDLMLRDEDRTVRIEDLEMGENSPHAGRSLKESAFRQKFNVQILAVRPRGESRFDYAPDVDMAIEAGTVLVVLGEVSHVDELRRALSQ